MLYVGLNRALEYLEVVFIVSACVISVYIDLFNIFQVYVQFPHALFNQTLSFYIACILYPNYKFPEQDSECNNYRYRNPSESWCTFSPASPPPQEKLGDPILGRN
jgi:hypothetical protein